MSYPYPQDRHRDRKEKGEQPYKDARDALTQSEAELHRAASGDQHAQDESPEEHATRLRAEATDRISRVTREIEYESDGRNDTAEPADQGSGA